MKPPIARIARILGLAALFALAACGKERGGAGTSGKPDPSPPPGAKNDDPLVARVSYSDLDYVDGIFTLKGKKYTGIAEDYHEDGKTLSKLYEIEDGVFHGTTREYYENGNISATTLWEKGLRHGPNVYWNEEGKEIKRQRYDHDVAVETIVLDGTEDAPHP